MTTPELIRQARIKLGRHLAGLRDRKGLTQEEFAELIHFGRSTLASVETGYSEGSRTFWQGCDDQLRADGALLLAYDELRAMKLAHIPAGSSITQDIPLQMRAEAVPRIDNLNDADGYIDWISDWSGETRGQLLQQWTTQSKHHGALGPKNHKVVDHLQIATTLLDYYGVNQATEVRPCVVTLPGYEARLSIVCRPEWTNLSIPLFGAAEATVWKDVPPVTPPRSGMLARASVGRLAELGREPTRAVDAHLFRLLSLDANTESLNATFGVTSFLHHAITTNLMEMELLNSLGQGGQPNGLPIRDILLPNLAALGDLSTRNCVGGTECLFAAARKEDYRRRGGDFVLLVQQRSKQVINGVGRLATIPKAFHQPINDPVGETALSATLLRELEEELFGRAETDHTERGTVRQADPMHQSLLTPPLAWLAERIDTDAWRMECVGVGFDLVSGNYEFACLIMIEDPQWWELFGGRVKVNWESDGIRMVSSSNRQAIQALMADPSWSNEGLFAFAEGLRRLGEITGSPEGPVTGRGSW